MKIIYVYDALCGWCYGFSPVMIQFYEKYKDCLQFEVISGGMITGDRIGPIGEVASYISWAYKEVENATNIRFGNDFLNKTLKNGTAIFTSIVPAIALSVFKSQQPDKSVQFALAAQKAIYYAGIEPNDNAAYGMIASNFGFNPVDFVAQMSNSTNVDSAQKDFELSHKLGVTGFPTVFLEFESKYYKMASGCVHFDVLENNFLTIKSNLK